MRKINFSKHPKRVLYDAMSFTPLGDALHKRMERQSPLKKQIEASQVIECAQKVFNDLFPAEALQVKPLFLKNRTLTITCGSSVIAQEIRLSQTVIVERINTLIGKSEVDRIRYLA